MQDLHYFPGHMKKTQRAIEEKIFPPLSDLQAFTVRELQKVSYKLYMLCILGGRQEQEAILISEGWTL